MTVSENKEFVRRYLEAISGRPKPAAVLDLFMTDDSLKQHIQAVEASFPLYRLDVDEMIAEGDLVAVRGFVHGIHRGELAGIPATGKSVEYSIFITYRIVNGKIADHWRSRRHCGKDQPGWLDNRQLSVR